MHVYVDELLHARLVVQMVLISKKVDKMPKEIVHEVNIANEAITILDISLVLLGEMQHSNTQVQMPYGTIGGYNNK